MIVLPGAAHSDKGKNFESQRFSIDVNGVVAENTDFFHLAQSFPGSGGRKANSPRKLSQAQAGILLKELKELPSMNIEQCR
jgi:hypothetical protein